MRTAATRLFRRPGQPRRWPVTGWLGLAMALAAAAAPADDREPRLVGTVDVAPAWAGHPVGFALVTAGERQYVAFYAADRHLTVAARTLDRDDWTIVRLPTAQDGPPAGPGQTSAVVGWDSHNSIEMAVDAEGQVHLAGNMHDTGLTYYRTRVPGEVATFVQLPAMTGHDETRCTYPLFLTRADGALVFRYRSGRSGDGDVLFNIYDPATRGWRRLFAGCLFDGERARNAYPLPPVRGPDGCYHLSWVWRETADCATNHDLCHARSRDLVAWETAGGRPLGLPIRLATPGVTVDPVPIGGGILNGTGQVGFDTPGRPVLAYFKYDVLGVSQAYVARFERDGWRIVQLSDWDRRIEFAGEGSLPKFELGLTAVRPAGPGALRLGFWHPTDGSGEWVLDEATLGVLRREPPLRRLPRGLGRVESRFPGMQVRFAEDSGTPPPGRRFVLRWETLPANRDQPRRKPWPAPSMLRVAEVRDPPPDGVR